MGTLNSMTNVDDGKRLRVLTPNSRTWTYDSREKMVSIGKTQTQVLNLLEMNYVNSNTHEPWEGSCKETCPFCKWQDLDFEAGGLLLEFMLK